MPVRIREARKRFSALLRRVAAGEEVVVSRAGKPVARIVPVEAHGARRFGIDRGVFEVPDDFDAPLPAGDLEAFDR
jgi:prevent-host-death family protein